MQVDNKQKPKILYLITKSNFGGAQKYVFDLASDEKVISLFDVSVAVGGEGELVERLEKNERIKVIKLKHLQNTLSLVKTLKIISEIVKLIKKEKPDLIHINSSLAGLTGSVAAIITDTKSVFTAHGWPFNETRPVYQKIILKILMGIVVLISNRTIAVSKNISEQLYFSGSLLKNKFVIIYNGIKNIEFFKREETISKFNIDENKLNIVSVGELHTSKGHDIAIDALKDLKEFNFHYHIIGEGLFRKELENKIVYHKLEKHVTMHGQVKDAAKYLENFDLFLLPSRTEALGYVALEAYAAGLPVIATNVGGVPEVIREAGEGSIVRANKEDIREILGKYLSDHVKDGVVIRKTKNKKIIWHHKDMIENTLALYKNILKI